MALGDIGMWLPAESQYAAPGSYDESLRAEAVKNASYLASMDQFYANLDEAKSEFNKTLAFKEKELATSKELSESGLDIQKQQLALQKEQLDWEKQYQGGLLSVQQEAQYTAQQKEAAGEKLASDYLSYLKDRTSSVYRSSYGGSSGSGEVSFSEPTTPDYTGDYGYSTQGILNAAAAENFSFNDYGYEDFYGLY